MEHADASAEVKAVLIVGQGKAFIAGADIREFGKPPVAPFLPDVCNRIEACSKPVVAVILAQLLGVVWKFPWPLITVLPCLRPSWACQKFRWV